MTERTILVVDDDDDIREITSLSLETIAGWNVIQANNGEACLQQAREHRPSAVLLDVMMPGLDGPTTFSRMQADEELADIPVILLTAKVQFGDREKWDKLAVAGVIAKPFNPISLSEEVSAILGWSG